jgi:hypothetical protein
MEKDSKREKRIDYGPICDAYTDEEVSNGWDVYMEEGLIFPFKAKIIGDTSSKIPIGETVIVTDSYDDFDIAGTVDWIKDNSYGIYELEVKWNNEEFSIAIEDLQSLDNNIDTIEVIKDWNYWLENY